jgi:hypothetical protein
MRKSGTYTTVCGIRKRYPVRTKFNIKNWKKVIGQKDSWENTKTYSGVSVEKLGNDYYVEERYIIRLMNQEVRRIIEKDLTYEQAKKVAFRYMRDHSDFR